MSTTTNNNHAVRLSIVGSSHVLRMMGFWENNLTNLTDYHVRYTGIPGASVKTTWERDLFNSMLRLNRPTYTVVMLGGNDCDSYQTLSNITSNLEALLLRFQSNHGNIIFPEIIQRHNSRNLTISQVQDRITKVNLHFSKWCPKHNISFLSLKRSQIQTTRACNNKIFLKDNTHLTDKGYTKITYLIQKHIRQLTSVQN
jgi:lysophospholipase L1-like esterase